MAKHLAKMLTKHTKDSATTTTASLEGGFTDDLTASDSEKKEFTASASLDPTMKHYVVTSTEVADDVLTLGSSESNADLTSESSVSGTFRIRRKKNTKNG